jgi:stage IV sporulation protein FB
MFTFNLGKIPVTIHFWFLLVGVFLMGNVSNPASVILWLAIFFVSVLAHELGHALAGIAFGLEPRIDLHGMGGTTSWRHKNVSAAKKIIISIAGPAVGIFFGGLLYFFHSSVLGENPSPMAEQAVSWIIFVNLIWGALNLLPMLPLDGGNVMAHSLGAAMGGEKGMRVAHYISAAVAIGAGLLALVLRLGWWSLAMAALFAFQNIKAIRPAQNGPPTPPVAPQQW